MNILLTIEHWFELVGNLIWGFPLMILLVGTGLWLPLVWLFSEGLRVLVG